MARLWQRTLDFLGLSDDEGYDDEGYDDPAPPAYQTRRSSNYEPEPSASVRTIPSPSNVSAAAPIPSAESGVGNVSVQPRSASVRTITPVPQGSRVHVVSPSSFADCQEIGERFRTGSAVIINLQGVDRELGRRIIDFASGLAFGLKADIKRIADRVFMLSTSNLELSAEEKRKLQERGFYES